MELYKEQKNEPKKKEELPKYPADQSYRQKPGGKPPPEYGEQDSEFESASGGDDVEEFDDVLSVLVEPIPQAYGGSGVDWKYGDDIVYPKQTTAAMIQIGLVLEAESGKEVIDYKDLLWIMGQVTMPLTEFLENYADESNPKSQFFFPQVDKIEELGKNYDLNQCMILCRDLKQEQQSKSDCDIDDEECDSDSDLNDQQEIEIIKTWFILCVNPERRKLLKESLAIAYYKVAEKWSDDELPKFENGQDIDVWNINLINESKKSAVFVAKKNDFALFDGQELITLYGGQWWQIQDCVIREGFGTYLNSTLYTEVSEDTCINFVVEWNVQQKQPTIICIRQSTIQAAKFIKRIMILNFRELCFGSTGKSKAAESCQALEADEKDAEYQMRKTLDQLKQLQDKYQDNFANKELDPEQLEAQQELNKLKCMVGDLDPDAEAVEKGNESSAMSQEKKKLQVIIAA